MSNQIPLWILKDLRCKNCNLFLSHGPVYLIKDGEAVCSRCKVLAKHNYRNWIYEELAGNFKFPCAFWENRCPAENCWNFGYEHELHCAYKGGIKLLCVNPLAYFSSKRKLPSEGNLFFLEMPENRISHLLCKTCKLILSSEPIYTNIVGDNTCHRCFISNGIPPNTLRNSTYEKLANILYFPCIFTSNGCQATCRFGRDAWAHEMSCQFKSNTQKPQMRIISHRYTIGGETNKEYPSPLRLPKEKGVVATHSGHVYATLTPNNVPFLPPQLSNNLNGQRLTKELQDKFRRETKDNLEEKLNFRYHSYQEQHQNTPPFLKKTYIDNENFDEKFAPLVKEYAQHNPQNVQRSDSLSIGNKDIIAEMKLRQEKRLQRQNNFVI